MSAPLSSPDAHGSLLAGAPLDALRYDGQTADPHEVAGIVRAMLPERARVLDVGCGTGALTLIANAGKNNTVKALEPDPARAEVARGRGLDVTTGLLDPEWIAANGQFDAVMACDVLEHVTAPAEFLALLVAATRPGGQVILSVPNVAHWSVRANLLLGRWDYEPTGIMDATHLRWFTERSLRALLGSAGLSIELFRHSAGADLPPYCRGLLGKLPGGPRVRATRLAARLLPRLFGAQHVVRARTPG